MEPHARLLLAALVCTAIAALIAGCTAGTPAANTTTPAPTPPVTATAATPATTTAASLPTVSLTLPVAGTGGDDTACTTDSDCVPRECCHPASCENREYKHVCTLMCTDVCMGPVDCGAGHCGCVDGKCAVQPGPAP